MARSKAQKRSATVVIEGTVTPCTEYPRGVRATVEYDEHIERLINGGFVAVVPDDDDEGPQLTAKDSDVEQQQAVVGGDLAPENVDA